MTILALTEDSIIHQIALKKHTQITFQIRGLNKIKEKGNETQVTFSSKFLSYPPPPPTLVILYVF